MATNTEKQELLDAAIKEKGSLSLYNYMMLCLQHPEYGYYTKGNPIGRSGDFITAPEISQLFGESLAFFYYLISIHYSRMAILSVNWVQDAEH